MDQNQQSKKVRDENKAKMRGIKRVSFWLLVILVIGGSIFGLVKMTNPENQDFRELTKISPGLNINSDDNVYGNASSSVVLIEYSDFQCPACKAYDPIVSAVVEDYKDQIAFVYRYYPLPQHFNAKITAQAAEAAGEQGKFWEMKKLLFEEQSNWSRISASTIDVTLVKYAERLDLDIKRFTSDLRSKETQNKVVQDLIGGQQARVSGTPTFFLNGLEITPRSEADFVSLIEEALTKNAEINQ